MKIRYRSVDRLTLRWELTLACHLHHFDSAPVTTSSTIYRFQRHLSRLGQGGLWRLPCMSTDTTASTSASGWLAFPVDLEYVGIRGDVSSERRACRSP